MFSILSLYPYDTMDFDIDNANDYIECTVGVQGALMQSILSLNNNIIDVLTTSIDSYKLKAMLDAACTFAVVIGYDFTELKEVTL